MFDFLESELNKYHVAPQRLPDAELYQKLLKDDSHIGNLEGFYCMLQTFLSLHKNGTYSTSEIAERLHGEDKYSATRNAIFRRIYARIYDAYEQYLFRTRQYDFADMINVAKCQVEEVDGCARGYEYILLDEVQDLSRNRLLLIRSILRKNPGCKLFAVGDDWQSIYRFAGSDLTLIKDFEQIFGLATRRSFIESTHRFGQPTTRISCDFIQRNPAQSHKMVRSPKQTTTPIYVIFNKQTKQKEGQDAESLQVILQRIIAQIGIEVVKQKSIQVISRYNHDIRRLKSKLFKIAPHRDSADIFNLIWRSDMGQELKLEFCSMHKSKGITRDIVIVLNMNSGLNGMPAVRESDPIINALLAKDEPYSFAEERRLFYVAITRAREATYLIANSKNPSPFIREIFDEQLVV